MKSQLQANQNLETELGETSACPFNGLLEYGGLGFLKGRRHKTETMTSGLEIKIGQVQAAKKPLI